MSYPVFPALAGVTWPVVRRPLWNTQAEQTASGAEFRTGTQQYPIWEFDLIFTYMSQADVNSLLGLYNNQKAAVSPFYFDSINDDTIPVASPYGLGTGNGTQTVFQLLKPVGSFVDLAGGTPNNWGVTPGTNNVIYDNGTPVAAANYSASDGGFGSVITFTTAPAAGHVITWTGVYYYLCRFKDDSEDFEQFASQMYELKKLTLRTVR